MLQEEEASPGNHINLNSQRAIRPKSHAVEFCWVFTYHFHHLFSWLFVWNQLLNSTFELTNNWDEGQKHSGPPHYQKSRVKYNKCGKGSVSAETFKGELRYLMIILIFCKRRALALSKAGSSESISWAIDITDGFEHVGP